jgi:anthranilate 1,2-dioxygenase small subunit
MNAITTHGRPVSDAIRHAITDLLQRYVDMLDDDDLEAWPQLFLEDGQYRVLSRENVALGLPAPLMYYYSRGMMHDRVKALREALTYQPMYSRHVLSAARLAMNEAGEVHAGASFSLYQTTEEGVTQLFTTGRYADVVALTESGPRFRSRTVTMDSFGVKNLIAVPL